MSHQVVIVGAGPGGAAAAIALAQRNVRDVVLVDRAHFPRDKTCGSAISPLGLRVLAELDVEADVRRRARTIHSLKLTTPGGRRLTLRGGEAAVVLLRKDFDQLLVDRARKLGVTFRDGMRVTHLIRDGSRVTGVRTDDEEIAAHTVICADGAYSRFSCDPRSKQTLATIVGWWEEFDYEPGTIEMIFDRMLCPLYGWMFPESESRVNIGIVVDGQRTGPAGDLGSLRPVFEAFLEHHFRDRLTGARPVGRWSGHPIVHSVWPRALSSPGVLYVGESGRLTNAATGEGIYQAMRCGVLAADWVAKVLHGEIDETGAWRNYSRACQRTFSAGFATGRVFRGAVRVGMLDAIARAYDHPSLRRVATWLIGSALTASSLEREKGEGKREEEK
jgi:geranylgeranyl reductase family protein